jgi:hypothetical protein
MDIVEQVATEISEIPGDPSSLEIARIAIEAYQRALWTPHFGRPNRVWPELRRNRANQLTAHILSIVGKYLCDHGDVRGHREASRDLFEVLYESGAEVITDADRATAGLSPRGPYGLTEEQLRILDARYTEAMLRPMPSLLVPAPHS